MSPMNLSQFAKTVAWNAMLATIPVVTAYAVALVARFARKTGCRILLMIPLALVWFVFLPNTCYLLTEWRHFLFIMYVNNLYWRAETDRSCSFNCAL